MPFLFLLKFVIIVHLKVHIHMKPTQVEIGMSWCRLPPGPSAGGSGVCVMLGSVKGGDSAQLSTLQQASMSAPQN